MNICQNCKREFALDDDCSSPETDLCMECFIYRQYIDEENLGNWMQVTREMAKDAGDISMEGTWIRW